MTKIMVVDDDKYIRELVSILLRNAGFDVYEGCDGEDALDKFEHIKIDLFIIDIMMPRMDGYELCESIRSFDKNIPILMLSAKSDLKGKVTGFDKGTDDYLTKPFEKDELLARVRALLRRYNIVNQQILKVGNITIDKSSYKIIIKDQQEVLDMPLKEFELLYKLAGSIARTFSRELLLEDIWGYDFDGNERTLDVHINRLRDKFPEEKYGFKITTIRGLGYRLEETYGKT